MSEDRELIELAAKAAGISGHWGEYHGSGDYYYNGQSIGLYIAGDHMTASSVWNPLMDDGDALRLAISLKLEIEFNRYSFRVYAGPHDTAPWAEDANDSQDKFAATRRAIVSAAAEIGREMS